MEWNTQNKMRKIRGELYQTPLKDLKDNNSHDSVFESPIESESRLINKSIRGDTDR